MEWKFWRWRISVTGHVLPDPTELCTGGRLLHDWQTKHMEEGWVWWFALPPRRGYPIEVVVSGADDPFIIQDASNLHPETNVYNLWWRLHWVSRAIPLNGTLEDAETP